MRRIFKVAIGGAVGALCPVERLLRMRGGSADLLVLTFHRIATQPYFRPGMVMSRQAFGQFLDFLSDHVEVVDLESAIASGPCASGRMRVAITFDDGYRDNYDNALPELSRHGFPATVFLATNLIDDPIQYLWWDQLDYVFRDWATRDAASRKRILDVVSMLELTADQHSPRDQLLNGLVDCMRTMKASLRDQLLADITSVSGSDFQTNPERPRIMLCWDEVCKMRDAGIAFGGHSVSHANLDEIDMDDLEHEISHCRTRIEEMTGRVVTSFAYPYGWYSAKTVDVLLRCGYRMAVTCDPGPYRGGADPMRIPRIALSEDDLRGISSSFSRNMWNFQMLRACFVQV